MIDRRLSSIKSVVVSDIATVNAADPTQVTWVEYLAQGLEVRVPRSPNSLTQGQHLTTVESTRLQ